VVTPAGSDAVLVVDGVFAFRPEINEHWEFRIWVDVDPEEALRRGVERDEDWAGSEAEAVHRDRYHVSEQLYLAEVDPVRLVDVVIDNSDFEHPRIVLEH
jgi:uridine kinase